MKFTTKPKNHYRELQKSVKEGEVLIVPLDNRLLEDAKPFKAGGKNIPRWFRNAPKEGIRNCAGVQDFLNLGFILPCWTDFSFTPRPEMNGWELRVNSLPFAPMPFESDPFPYQSTGSCPMTDHRKIEGSPYPKLVNPFAFVTAPGWSLIIQPIPYEPNPHYDVIPAIVNTDYYHHINVVLNLKGDEQFTIRYGEPLAQIIPFKRSADVDKLLFATEDDFKYVSGRGMSSGPIRSIGEGAARGYRRIKRRGSSDS